MSGYGHDESAPTPCGVFRNPFRGCSQHYWQTVSSCRVRFIVPAYMKTPTKWRTDMCVRLCGNVCAIMCIHIFDYVRIRARWIGPYAWRNVRNPFRGCFVCISLVDVALLQPVSNVVAMRSEYIHGVFATCSLSVCYIFAMQKYGFCVAKVWFLACKKWVFALQKYGFCFLNVVLLQFV